MREMKDSGIEWIGEIPKHWKIKKPKYIGSIRSGDSVTNKKLNDDIGYEVLGGNGTIGFYDKYNVDGTHIIIGRVGALCGNSRITRGKKFISDNALIYTCFEGQAENYINYIFDAFNLNKLNTSNAQPLITGSKVLNIFIPYPYIIEQKIIADFLDSKCSEIDATAEDIQKEITLLEEYKKSVITEAVTKGLNPDAEMKDSGIEGIKEIPVISKVVRLKYLVDKKITDGTHKTPEYATVDDGSPFLSSKDVRNGYIDWSNVKYITKTLHNILHKEVCCKRGDILLAKNGTTGVAALVDTDDVFDIYVTLAVIRSDKKKVLPEYLLYSINSNVTKEQFSERLVGIGVPNLHLNVIANTNIIVYEISEQQKIVKYLNEKCSCIDDAILIKKKQLEMLADYKKSLIYEYVTGKKEVPHE